MSRVVFAPVPGSLQEPDITPEHSATHLRSKGSGPDLTTSWWTTSPRPWVATIAARKAFIEAYRVARARWLSTSKVVVFPEGTWQLRCDPRAIVSGVTQALPPPVLIAA